MQWFRSRKWASRLALFALALQLVLSFGHAHATDFTTHNAAAVAASAAVTAPATDGVPDAYCPICIAIHLAGSSAPPAPPVLPLPVAFETALPQTHATVALTTASHLRLQARAPPSV